MKSQSEQNLFHITVGVAPSNSHDISHELALLKAALLYADKVKFCSPAASILIMLLQLGNLPSEQLLEIFSRGLDEEQQAKTTRLLDLYQQLKPSRKRRRSKQEIVMYKRLEQQLERQKERASEHFTRMAADAGLAELETAFDSGIVEIEIIGGENPEEAVTQFFESVSSAIQSSTTYPLLDRLTSNVVRESIREGKLAPSRTSQSRAKQVGLSTDLFRRLPLFDDAPMDVILAIRNELQNPLVRFRSAIIKFSQSMENVVWNEEFPIEAEEVFRKSVKPEILNIEEALKSNSLIRSIMPSLVDKSVLPITSSVLGFLLADATELPSIVSAGLGATIGSAASIYKLYQEWKETNREIKENQLYFYYEAGKRIGSST